MMPPKWGDNAFKQCRVAPRCILCIYKSKSKVLLANSSPSHPKLSFINVSRLHHPLNQHLRILPFQLEARRRGGGRPKIRIEVYWTEDSFLGVLALSWCGLGSAVVFLHQLGRCCFLGLLELRMPRGAAVPLCRGERDGEGGGCF